LVVELSQLLGEAKTRKRGDMLGMYYPFLGLKCGKMIITARKHVSCDFYGI
jgi:hypothetical protein